MDESVADTKKQRGQAKRRGARLPGPPARYGPEGRGGKGKGEGGGGGGGGEGEGRGRGGGNDKHFSQLGNQTKNIIYRTSRLLVSYGTLVSVP